MCPLNFVRASSCHSMRYSRDIFSKINEQIQWGKKCGIGTYSSSLDGSVQNTALLGIKDITHVITHSVPRAHISAKGWVSACGDTAVLVGGTGQPGSHQYHFYSAGSRVADLSCHEGVTFLLSLGLLLFCLCSFSFFSSPKKNLI